MKSEVRKDYFLNKYVIITPFRARRPRSTTAKTTFIKIKNCPFCIKNIDKDLIVNEYFFNKNKKIWDIMVLKNKYPVVTPDNTKAYGKHEVVIETPSHGKELSQLSVKNIINLLQVFKHRTEELSKIKNIDYILIFKNKGGKSGATIKHAHCQIFCSKIIPPDLEEESLGVEKYYKEHKTCPYCDIIKKEQKGPRKIYADKYVVAFTPYASSFHYETWIFPRKHIDNICDMNDKETEIFAKVLKNILQKIYKLNLSYNFFLHQVVSNQNQHFYLKIQPREAVWGGIELGSGIIINSLLPEKAAKYLKIKQ